MNDLRQEVENAIYKSIKKVANKFQKQPYYYLYESDIHCELYINLIANYNHMINLEVNNDEPLISNAIHSEPNIGESKYNRITPDFLIYHTDNPVKILFKKRRRIYFSSNDLQSRTLIELKFNRSPEELQDAYTVKNGGLLSDIDKIIKYNFDKAYFLFFDRSLKIDDDKNSSFIDKIKRRTIENKKIEVVYIGADITNPENGFTRFYSNGKIK